MYRALYDLSTRHGVVNRNTLFASGYLGDDVERQLLALGKIAIVSAPPLAVCPGFESIARRLENHGIINADEFLERDNMELARLLRRNTDGVQALKSRLIEALSAPHNNG